jgi:antitoxin component YwqK of YwqJK toxin-antitoxin module
MKKLLFIFLLLPAFISCGPGTVKVVEETYPDGKEKLVVYYTDNDAHEKVREEVFYPNGDLQRYGEFKNNQAHGIWRVWYKNGNIWSEGEFKDGEADGFRKVYYENAQLRYRGFFTKGQKSGTWEFYDENGKLQKKEEY